MQARQQVHASCVSRNGDGVLLIGPSGSGKSDLALRLLGRGFTLVADDRVDIEDSIAAAPAGLAGLLEVRGLGIVRLPFAATARLALVADLGGTGERLPAPGGRHADLDLPLIRLDPAAASAPERIVLALDCALGRVAQVAGAFAA
jgi:HPr kinase/phosphorylase